MRNYTNSKGYKFWLHVAEAVGAGLNRLHVWLYSVWLILILCPGSWENFHRGSTCVSSPRSSSKPPWGILQGDCWVAGRSTADRRDKECASKESVSLCHVKKWRSLCVTFLIFGKEGAATVVSVSRRGWGWIKVDLWKSHGWWNSK